MKKEVNVLSVKTKKGIIGGEKAKTLIRICNDSVVVETDAIEGIIRTDFEDEDDDQRAVKVKKTLDDNNLKMFSIILKSGTKIYNCIMPVEKPLISFFDE